ncbi:dienelactone hydrolase family protein [Chromobacterium sp. CV08]|uniref:dienelactone hydrolase family protein n=1 Tax=Chromobacterium sp. CV08 TaxID=3133274 RepID=UPI003DA7DD5D
MSPAILSLLLVLFAVPAAVGAESMPRDIGEEVVSLPVTLPDGSRHALTVTVFRPDDAGPHPLALLSHGRATSAAGRADPPRQRMETAARYLVRKGFVVLVPTRAGYGADAGGADPEDSGPCRRKDYPASLRAAVAQILAALDYGRRQPDFDGRAVLIGQSVGGIATVAAAAENPPGVVAAINFAGGAGGDPDSHPGVPCSPAQLQQLYAEFGGRSRVPMLWIYTRNDRFFGPEYSQAWARAYRAAGAPLDYRLLPAFGDNGHLLFSRGADIWMPLLEDYLRGRGFVRPGFAGRPPPSGYAALDDGDRIPYLSRADRLNGYGRFLSSPLPRAFAISPSGHWGYAYGGDAIDRALDFCHNDNPSPCSLYAVDCNVVWPGGDDGH